MKKKTKSIFFDLDIILPSRFLLQRNVLFSSPFHSFSPFLLSFFLLFFSNTRFHHSACLFFISSNFILTSPNTLSQTSCYPIYIAKLLYTSPAIPFSYIPLFLLFFLLLVISLLLSIFLQSHPPILLHFSNLPSFPMYHSLL